MPRDIPVGNGSLLVNFDAHYQLRDIYWPYVGQENHTAGAPCRFGVWVDNTFSVISVCFVVKKDFLPAKGINTSSAIEPETLN